MLDIIGQDKEQRLKNNDAMIWFLLQPVASNFRRILRTTKETVKSSKERANILGDELLVIGRYMDAKFSRNADDEEMKKGFWTFLAGFWPVDDTNKSVNSVTGQRLGNMYQTLKRRQAEREARSDPKRNGR